MRHLLLLLFIVVLASCSVDSIEELEEINYETNSEITTRACSDGYLEPSYIDEDGCCHYFIPDDLLENSIDEQGNPPESYYKVCSDEEPIRLTKVGLDFNGLQRRFCDLILDCACNEKSGTITHTIQPWGHFGDCCYHRINVNNTYNQEVVIRNISGEIETIIPPNSFGVIIEEVCLPETQVTFNLFVEDCEGNEVNVYDITIFHNCD